MNLGIRILFFDKRQQVSLTRTGWELVVVNIDAGHFARLLFVLHVDM